MICSRQHHDNSDPFISMSRWERPRQNPSTPTYVLMDASSEASWMIPREQSHHRQIPSSTSFSICTAAARRQSNMCSTSSCFDHVPLDVDKKMFRGDKQEKKNTISSKMKVLSSSSEVSSLPRSISVVSPVGVLDHHQQHHSHSRYGEQEEENEQDDMPEATLQVIESLRMDEQEDDYYHHHYFELNHNSMVDALCGSSG